MPSVAFNQLQCPIEGEPLHPAENLSSWRCSQGHSFDVAKQGYLNLLPVQQKRSKDPGDSKEMVVARRDFLNSGFYQPLAASISEEILRYADEQLVSAKNPLNVLDAGCGEGYYLRELIANAGAEQLSIAGFDISKWAVLAAAKQGLPLPSPNLAATSENTARWFVASNAHIPVQDASVDVVLCVFGFPVYSEFLRVLKPGGLLLMVDPGPEHLRELREVIYPDLKSEKPAKLQPEHFEIQPPLSANYQLTLENQTQINNLLAMTPHLFRAPAAGIERAQRLEKLTVTVDVHIQSLFKAAAI
ncbi:methylase involved in ubiquinone/menaquinone biosynthesis [Idiomarina sp. A28L]|uniref:putative RNA methyltransferase n=1 Tax=Idiomarina sp. A28L TaxID=1036674 RepID=UPI0002138B78|nr:methyltransferase domain-containing protein [Idiomarina sp. A28L]EGN75945.1 methylase involved in ubiquinone/menaquinone biosynthesis [Idiomarina sp. A28L]